jgi:hypothetical protein
LLVPVVAGLHLGVLQSVDAAPAAAVAWLALSSAAKAAGGAPGDSALVAAPAARHLGTPELTPRAVQVRSASIAPLTPAAPLTRPAAAVQDERATSPALQHDAVPTPATDARLAPVPTTRRAPQAPTRQGMAAVATQPVQPRPLAAPLAELRADGGSPSAGPGPADDLDQGPDSAARSGADGATPHGGERNAAPAADDSRQFAALALPAPSAWPPQRAASARPAGTAPAPLPTIVPANAELVYSVRRGPLAGKGRLVWRQDGSAYSASLEARLPVLGAIFTETSTGGFDSHGLAPQRHTERRLRRSERALSMTRDAAGNGTLSFSSSTQKLALPPGTQDRVSWLVQLAAVFGAASASPGTPRLPPGVSLPVASVNGDLRIWQFRLLPPGAADGGLLHLERRPAPGEFDTTAEVWLDPARHAWPVKVVLSDAGAEALELRLEQLLD